LTRGAFDAFLEGDLSALDKKAQKGLNIFIDLGCKACHFGRSVGGQIMQRFPINTFNGIYPEFGYKNGHFTFHSLRFKLLQSDNPFPFPDKGHFYGYKNSLKFKVPQLRNITKTAPYFHNGTVKNLDEVIKIMAKYQRGADLTKEQIGQIHAFLQSLEGDLVKYF
jgi:cytochrome c peroxidase